MDNLAADAWLWTALAALGYYAALTVHKQLVAVQEATDTTHHDEPSFGVFHTTEESIELETLEVLYRSPSDEIRGAAIKIVVERIYKNSDVDSPWNVLLFDIRTNTKSARQHKALAILRFLNESHDGSEVAQERFSSMQFCQALVDCLILQLPEAIGAETVSANHSQWEYDALWLLYRSLLANRKIPSTLVGQNLTPFHFQATAFSIAGVVHKWLIRYPFGGRDRTLIDTAGIIKDHLNVRILREDSPFGHLMYSVLWNLFSHAAFRKDLEKYCPPEPEDATQTYSTAPDETQDKQEDNETLPDVSPSPRGIEQSPEEQALRRRRREAMVLTASGQLPQREDIFEPDSPHTITSPVADDEPVDDVPDGEVQEEFEQLLGEIIEAEAAKEETWLGWLSRLRPDGLAPRYRRH